MKQIIGVFLLQMLMLSGKGGDGCEGFGCRVVKSVDFIGMFFFGFIKKESMIFVFFFCIFFFLSLVCF